MIIDKACPLPQAGDACLPSRVARSRGVSVRPQARSACCRITRLDLHCPERLRRFSILPHFRGN
jgi:hypothetical protein